MLSAFIDLQLVFALFAVVNAKPGFVYTTGHFPAATVPLTHTAYTVPHVPQVVPYAVHTPVVTNTCKNGEGALVPCAHPGAGPSIYSFNNVGHPVVQTALGTVAAPTAEAPAAEAPAQDSGVVSVQKREAEASADPYYYYNNYYGALPHYYGHNYYWGGAYTRYPFYGFYGFPNYGGCRNGYGSLVPCAIRN